MKAAPRQVRLRAVPARRGALWVRQGLAIFFTKPLAFCGLLGMFLFGMLMLALLPWIGPLLFLACLPLVTLGFMLASQLSLRGESPGPAVFVRPLTGERTGRIGLIQLGLMYAFGTAVIMLLCHLLDGGKMMALQEAMNAGASREEVQAYFADSQLQQGLLWRMLLTSLLSLPFWHAPALVHWGGQSAAKSLFFSTMAVWQARGAFTVYGLVGFALLMGFGALAGIVLALLGEPEWASVIVMPGLLVFAGVFYASLFFSFADSFELSAAVETPAVEA